MFRQLERLIGGSVEFGPFDSALDLCLGVCNCACNRGTRRGYVVNSDAR